MRIAIIAVAYNRTDSLCRLLTSLEQADYPEPATLIISVDKSDTDAVERFADDYHWPHGEKRVAKHETNLGLRAHMLSLGQYFAEFDALVVLEDDVTVSPSFYHYTKTCVEKYFDDERIAGISLYSFAVSYQTHLPFTPLKTQYDAYLMNCAQSWGEVWMRPSWQAFKTWYDRCSDDFSSSSLPRCLGEWPRSSWLKYHTRYCIEQDRYFLFPYHSLTTNNADPGVNFVHADTLFQVPLLAGVQTSFRLPETGAADVALYDGFFQDKRLGQCLGIADEDLCTDLFAEKSVALYRHYVLTNRLLPYKVVRSFALQLRPAEMNVICRREGCELFLYDTTQAAPAPAAPDRYLAYAWFYGKGFYKARTMIGVRRILSLMWKMVARRLS